MSATEFAPNISSLQKYEQVASDYQHRQKRVKPGEALITPQVYLKWYDIFREESPIPPQFIHEARSFLCSELEAGNLLLKNELGFAIHHQCSGVHILYICTWRNENEVWETIYHKHLSGDEIGRASCRERV